jgi:hypothetical protein
MRTKYKLLTVGVFAAASIWTILALSIPRTGSAMVSGAIESDELPQIKRAIRSKNWETFGQAISQLDYSDIADSFQRLFMTRIANIAGYSGR